MRCFGLPRRYVYPRSAPREPVAAAPTGQTATPPLRVTRSVFELSYELLSEVVDALPFDIAVSTASGQTFSNHGHPLNPVGTMRLWREGTIQLRSGAVLTCRTPVPDPEEKAGAPRPMPATESAAENFLCIASASSPTGGISPRRPSFPAMPVMSPQPEPLLSAAALESLPAQALVATLTGTNISSIRVNRRWAEFNGLNSAQDPLQLWYANVHVDDIGRMQEAWTRAIIAGGDVMATVRVRRAADGVFVWFRCDATPIRDAQGSASVYTALL